MWVIGQRAIDGGKSSWDRILGLSSGELAVGATSAQQEIEVQRKGTIVAVWALVYNPADGTQPSSNAAAASIKINDDPKTSNQFLALSAIGGGGLGIDPMPVFWKVEKGDKILASMANLCGQGGPSMVIALGFGLRYDD